MSVASEVVSRAINRSFKEREPKHVVQWADDHFIRSPESSGGKGGPWSTYGYQRFPLHSMADLGTVMTAIAKAVQQGLSKCALIGIGYESVHRQRANGIWLPRRSDADEFSNVQIASMCRDVEVVRQDLKTDVDKKDKDNTTRRRAFKGAQTYCRATQTLQDVSSITIETAWLDELSKMPFTIKPGKDQQGKSPVDGVKGRTVDAKWPKVNMLSTPTNAGVCQITDQFNKCREKFHRYFACPHCGTMQTLEWGDESTEHGFKWEKRCDEHGIVDDLLTSETAYYACIDEACRASGQKIYHRHLRDMDDNHAEWRSERLRFDEKQYKYFLVDDLDGDNPQPSPYSVGIQLRGWFNRRKKWSSIVFDFLEAVRDKDEGKMEKLIDWTQDCKAEAYQESDQVNEVRHTFLMARQRDYAECPEEVQAITSWWDLQQKGYIFGLTVGWGFGEECWLLSHSAPIGCPINTSVMRDNIVPGHERIYVKPSGARMPVMLSGVDAGWQPELAHTLAKNYDITKIIPTWGSKKIGAPVAIMPKHPSHKTGTFLTEVCPDTAKTTVYTRYTTEQPGPGYIHIPDSAEFDEAFIKQMVAEKRKLKNNEMRWDCRKGVRNEALDCMVGNLAMIRILQQRFGLVLRPFKDYVPPEQKESEQDTTMTISELAALARA